MKEQIKTFILTSGGGGENTKTSYIHDHFWVEKIQKLYFHDHFFFFVWGGGENKIIEMGRNKVLSFILKKTAVKMTGCLARFRSKGSLLICRIRNKDDVRVYHGISFIQKVKRPYQ